MKSKILNFEDLRNLKTTLVGKKIVHCHGVFDLFHPGHLAHLKSAKSFGDILVVTLTPDAYVNKGPGRPRYNQNKRLEMLAALEVVDFAALNQSPRATEAIKAIQPHFYVKGPDYKKKEDDITGGILEEQSAVEAHGGRLVFTDDEMESSTQLINEYFSTMDEKQKRIVQHIREQIGLESVLDEIDALSELKILVIGEPIVDTYVFCKTESISSKSPTVSATYLYQEDYAGGSLAIANHLASLGSQVSLLSTHGSEDYFSKLLKSHMQPSVKIYSEVLEGIPTPRKTRYMVPFRSQRIFELQELKADQWLQRSSKSFIEKIQDLSVQHDLTIVADFGHGLFEGAVLDTLKSLKGFIALNVQTNSGNYGFNPFTKHERFDYLSIDERECRIALQDRFSSVHELATRVASYFEDRPTSVTLGVEGSVFFDEFGDSHYCPTFFKEVVDTTGAGDAYFALSSALVRMESLQPLIPFLGNCCAGLKTRVMGNKSSVSKVDLVRTVTAILK